MLNQRYPKMLKTKWLLDGGIYIISLFTTEFQWYLIGYKVGYKFHF